MSQNQSPVRPYRSFYNDNAKAEADVYIVRKDQLAEAERIKKGPDVVVVDYRDSADPNMQVRQSYKIKTKASMEAVIQILLDYDKQAKAGSAWSRTAHSLMEEWLLHNIAYLLGVKPQRTGDVDFNNGDEGKGLWDFIAQV